jgi:hypothetical protein
MKDKITGPLFKWFGSKWQSSKLLPPPREDIVIEPFAGGAGYSLRHFDKAVLLAECNPNVAKLWQWLISEATETSIREIPLNVLEGTDIRTLGLSDGQALLMKHWQYTNNVGNCWKISPWGNKSGQWTENTRARVASEFHLISHWRFCSDAFETLESLKDAPATWLIDPPYFFNYQYGNAPIDYVKLAKLIQALAGHAIVCEAICPESDKKNPGAVPNWLPFEFWASRITSRRKVDNNHHSKELIYEKFGSAVIDPESPPI